MALKRYIWALAAIAVAVIAGMYFFTQRRQAVPIAYPSQATAPVVDERSAPASPPGPTLLRGTPPPLARPAIVQPAIWGRVVDTQGETIADALVAVYHRDRGAYRTTTDVAGTFAVGPIDALEYRVSASRAHYNAMVIEKVRTGGDELLLVLTPSSRAPGWVTDDAGRPITRFEVVYFKGSDRNENWWREVVHNERTLWSSRSDREGRFEIDDVTSGVPFRLGARAPGYEPAFVTVPAAEPGQAAEATYIRLKTGARISGRVLSPERVSVPGAAIHLRPNVNAPVIARSDGEGRFELTGLGEEPIELTATADAYFQSTVQVFPRRGETVYTEIVMGLGGAIEGTVWKGNAPASGQKVIVSRMTPPRILEELLTDTQGHYRVSGLGSGQVDVLAKWKSPETGPKPLRIQRQAWIEPGQTTIVDIVFPDTGASLEGIVTANGKPLPLAQVRGNVFAEESQSFFSTMADEDGFYRADDVLPGNAWIEVTARFGDVELKRNFDITLKADYIVRQDIDFDLTTGVAGFMSGLNADDVGQVLAFTGYVQVDTSTPEALMELEAITNGSSDIAEDGSFSIIGLKPGECTLVALVFSGASETGEDVVNTTRIATQHVTVPGAGMLHTTLILQP